MDTPQFAERLQEGGFMAQPDGGWVFCGSNIYHTQGDAADIETLRQVMRMYEYESVIIMGTMAGVQLSPQSRDKRVLMTMTLVRKAHFELYDSPLHIVGENALDSTAVLASAMKAECGGAVAPDFVNTQAIYARALTQGLAYPYMQPAVAQLFHQHAKNPEIYLCQVGDEHLTPGRWTFAEIACVVQNDSPEDVLIGLLIDGVPTLAPSPSEVFVLSEQDYLILITRKEGTRDEWTY